MYRSRTKKLSTTINNNSIIFILESILAILSITVFISTKFVAVTGAFINVHSLLDVIQDIPVASEPLTLDSFSKHFAIYFVTFS